MSLTASQLQDIIIVERVASVFSLIGAAFVVITFVLNDRYRKPINRLVFYATLGNVVTNIATLISTDGVEAGPGSSLCQLQAFLIQWFMPADALWTFAMGCNVWLSFFRSYDTAALRRLELKYLVACYGIPFIPAFIYLFISTIGRGRIYGSAVLWCWVSVEWDFLRVVTFYGPVWVVILCTIAIYVSVGQVIFKWRKQLISIGKDPCSAEYPATGIMITSEVMVTRSEANMAGVRPESARVGKKPSFLFAPGTQRHTAHTRAQRPSGGIDPNKAALKYCKCALLFFIALFVTWVPSTINRIYTIIRPTEVVFSLNMAAALVLPLQGFWNALIYMATSSFATKCLWEDICEVCRQHLPRQVSMRMSRQAGSLQPNQLADMGSKYGLSTTHYDTDRSSSQSELVGPAKMC